ncbi:MAG TPA: YceI family protein [Acidimicrobiales bacterium]
MSIETRALPLARGLWTLDPLHSQVSFTIRHLGVSKVRGRFNTFDASLQVGDGLDDTSVTAVIQVGSLDTGNADRDAQVLSPDFLDVERHPEIRFTSTRITGADEDWTLAGEATINGVTRPFEFPVEYGGVGDFNGTLHAGFSATGDLRRSDFGLDFGPLAEAGLGKVVRFELDLQFVEPSAGS